MDLRLDLKKGAVPLELFEQCPSLPAADIAIISDDDGTGHSTEISFSPAGLVELCLVSFGHIKWLDRSGRWSR